METRQRRWSWQLGTLFGIAIRVHVTLLALFAWIIVSLPLRGGGIELGLTELAIVVAVFLIVVIHELAHALVARTFGSRTREILLLPVGGIANIDRIPERPAQELAVAIAGPAANIVLAIALALALALAGADFFPSNVPDLASVGAQLLWINIALAGFNLIPAYPMDGGRILRALLAMRVSRERATLVASKVGRIIAVAFVVFGALYNPMLAVIGVIVWVLAHQELAAVTLRSLLRGVTAGDAMSRALDPVQIDDDPRHVAARMLADGVAFLPVVAGSNVRGVLDIKALATRLHSHAPHDVIGNITREVPIVTSRAPLADVAQMLDESDTVLVVDDGDLVGVLTLDQIARYGDLLGVPPRALAVSR